MRRAALVAAMLLATSGAALADTTVGAKADRSTVSLHVGDRLTIRLSECESCGYRWVTGHAPDAAVLRRVSSRFVPPHLAPGAVGGSGTRVIVYRAVRAGFTRIVLSSRGPDRRAHGAWRLAVRVR